MQRNMTEWIGQVIETKEKMAMPIMTYPGLNLIGKSVFEMVTSGEVQYECIKALSDRYQIAASATMVMALYVEAEAFGSEVQYSHHEIPSVTKKLVHTFDSLSELHIPEVGEGKTGEHIKASGYAAKNITIHPVFGGTIGPFSLAAQLHGISDIMTSILLEPDGSKELLRMGTEFIKKYAMAFKQAGCEGVIIAEPAAGLLGEQECDEFSSCFVKQIVDYVQDESFIVILHNCGNTVNLVKSMVSTGSAGFHFGNAVNMSDILPQIPSDRLAFGNIDPAAVIKNGTPETVRAKTIDLLKETASFKNFVLSSGCDIPPGTKMENIDAFFNALDEYNRSL